MVIEKTTIVYNLIAIAAEIKLFFWLSHKPKIRHIIYSLFLNSLLLITTAGILAVLKEDIFGFFRLLSYGLFIHGLIILTGLALLLRLYLPKFAQIALFLAVIIASIGIYSFFIEPYWLEISHYQITSHKIEKPIKIVVIADLQTDNWTKYEENTLQIAMAQKADMILFAGDYVQEANLEKREVIFNKLNAFLQKININAPLGVYAVQGNIEPNNWAEKIFNGVPVKTFAATETVKLDKLCLTGLVRGASFNRKLKIYGCDLYHIVLGHAPNFALGNIPADLLIAGHTHGGQVRLPFIGPMMTASRIPRKWAAGLNNINSDRLLLVSRGIGMERRSAPRFRFLCRPELVVIDLMPA